MKTLSILLTILIFLPLSATAPNSPKANHFVERTKMVRQPIFKNSYINSIYSIAAKESKLSNIPVEIIIAQAILESRNGKSDLTKKANNHFGIKCHNNWQGKRIFRDDDSAGECFRAYDSTKDSFSDYSRFLRRNNRYGHLFGRNWKEWARGLQKAGYATDKDYADKLILLIQTQIL